MSAAWSDPEYAQASVTAARVAPAVPGTCAGGLLAITFTWTAPVSVSPAPTSYLVHVRDTTGAIVQTATRTPAQGLSYSSLALLGGGTAYTFDVTAMYANGWGSTTIVGDAVVYALGATCAWRA
ncbi:fibronectin type III domain-containing protein [Agrococcus jejuensis]|uniref:fibronectin type III domain-containing protein n=1 Tax=Agrococcus jejuensis TaxID=399736 RepID=UPI0012FB173E|nr:fibronectin type III domain-containing protein [Agrococcus jejuensis]